MKHLLPGLFCFVLLSASAEEKKAAVASPESTDFIRFVETDEGDSLQTAIARSSYPDELQDIINRGPQSLNPSLGVEVS